MNRTIRILLLVAALLAGTASFAMADSMTVGFAWVSSNASTDVAGQFSLTMTDHGDDPVSFSFSNSGSTSATITAVYFGQMSTYFSTMSGLSFVSGSSSSGGSFMAPATPASMKNVSWKTTFSSDADDPPTGHEIDLGDTGVFKMTLASSVTFEDVVSAFGAGKFHIGIHVQSIGTKEDSD